MKFKYKHIRVAEKYARNVISGKITACYLTIRACERYFYDKKHAEEKGIYMDKAEACKAVDVVENLRHFKGEWAGQKMVMQPFQVFKLVNVFGWKWKSTGFRRFKHAYNSEARKNGKTQLAGAVGIKCMCADNEKGAEVYSAATKKDQAKIAWNAAVKMVAQDPILAARLTTNTKNISYIKTFSKFEPICSDSDTSDGFDPHAGIFDETHAWATRNLAEVIISGMGSRRQGLIWEITTAGLSTYCYGYENWEYTVKILTDFDQPGGLIDDSWFGIIYTMDKKDIEEEKWDDEEVWKKANPNLETVIKLDWMRSECKVALETPSKLTFFKTKNLNIWVTSDKKWLDMQLWSASGKKFNPEELYGRVCFPAFDLASKLDLASLVLYFPPVDEEENHKFICRSYLPEKNIDEMAKKNRAPFRMWSQKKFLTLTPGAKIDYDFIKKDLEGYRELYNIPAVGFDPYNATQLVTSLENDGWPMVQIGQGYKGMSEPSKEFESWLKAGLISHNNDPIFRWCSGNAVISYDAHMNIKPHKEKSRSKIDELVAAIMAIAVSRADVDGISMYENEDIRSV